MVRSLSRSDAFFIEYCLQQKWVLPCITIPHGAAGAVGQVDTDTLTAELRNTCHHERINQVGVVSDLEKWGLNKKSCPEIGYVWFYNQFIALMFLLSWYIMIPFFLILFFFVHVSSDLDTVWLWRFYRVIKHVVFSTGESLRAWESPTNGWVL